MAGLRFTDLQSRPMEFLDCTSLTLDEFQQLVPPFETAFHARMAAWQMDGKPRTARRFPVDKNCPLPTPADRLLFLLASLKTYALQVMHRRLFGIVPGQCTPHDPLAERPLGRPCPLPAHRRDHAVSLTRTEPVVTGSGLPRVHGAPGGHPQADQETPGRGPHAGATTGEPGAQPASAAP